ncbi:MAG: PH domain-containing protein [Anaerolineae bacterium]
MRVRSAMDRWFLALLWVVVGMLLASVAVVPADERPLAGVAVAPIIGLLAWILRGTYYELRDDHLLCRSGPFRERIPYSQIRSLRLTQNLLSSMALSTTRIEIRPHGKGYILGTTMISPVDREWFLGELRRRCPNLE